MDIEGYDHMPAMIQAAAHAIQILYAQRNADFRWQAVGNLDGVAYTFSYMGIEYADLYNALVDEKWRIINKGVANANT